jgi:hypothetical protein
MTRQEIMAWTEESAKRMTERKAGHLTLKQKNRVRVLKAEIKTRARAAEVRAVRESHKQAFG